MSPSSTRWAIKEKIDQMVGRCDKTKDELVDLANIYAEHHPDYTEIIFKLADHSEQLSKGLTALRDTI